MSVWTHVCGSIRFDGIAGVTIPPDLGKTCEFESPQKDWGACDVPCGSEGSLQYCLWTNPSPNQLARYTAMFWGDLRDYENEAEIIAYFKRITENQLIRQGVFTFEVEGQPKRTYLHHGRDAGWLECV